MAFGFSWFVKLLYADAVVSPLGTAMVQAAATGRMTYAMAQSGYLPKSLQALNPKQSPSLALSFNVLIGLLFFLPFPSWQKMVGFLVSCLVLGYVVGPISLLTLSRAMPEKLVGISPRRIKSVAMLAFYFCNLIIFWSGWSVLSKVMIAFALGYVILAVYVLKERAFKRLRADLKIGWWVVPYIILLGALSYCSSFGGGSGAIPFGWDFLWIAVLSIVFFLIANRCAASENNIQRARQELLNIAPQR